MLADTANLVRIEDLSDPAAASSLSASDLESLRTVATWIRTFVISPNKDLGRAGPVCPFVPAALEHATLWLAAETVAGRSALEIVEVIKEYQALFNDAAPRAGDDAVYKAFFVVFSDLHVERANAFFGDVLERLAVASYVTDGFSMGGFFEGNPATAIYNAAFQPFTSPVPALLIRRTVVTDWKFFIDDQDWLRRWAHRFGESGAEELATELRGLPWRADGD